MGRGLTMWAAPPSVATTRVRRPFLAAVAGTEHISSPTNAAGDHDTTLNLPLCFLFPTSGGSVSVSVVTDANGRRGVQVGKCTLAFQLDRQPEASAIAIVQTSCSRDPATLISGLLNASERSVSHARRARRQRDGMLRRKYSRRGCTFAAERPGWSDRERRR